MSTSAADFHRLDLRHARRTEGDTFWKLSQKYGISVDELLAANLGTDPGNIYPGLVINIPINMPSEPPVPEPPEEEEPTAEIPPEENLAKDRESLTYLFGGNTASYLKCVTNSKNSVKTIMPDYFDINQDGGLLITPANKIDPAFIAQMHLIGVKVIPFVSNHWDRPLGVKALENRQVLSSQIAEAAELYNLDGINVDIENVTDAHRAEYTDFTRLLRQKVPAYKSVSVAVAANPNGWKTGWHGSYDYKALAENSDFLLIMNYDESYQGGPAGPVSSANFFEKSIKFAFSEGVPKEKIVSGIPLFGRYWKQGEATGGIGITAGDIEGLIAGYPSKVKYDTAAQSANATVTIGKNDVKPVIWGGRTLTDGVYNIWYDNLKAVKYKLELIREYGIKGAGSWALGQEDPAIWDFYSLALNGMESPEPAAAPEPLAIPEPMPELEPLFEPAPKPELQPDAKKPGKAQYHYHYHYHYFPDAQCCTADKTVSAMANFKESKHGSHKTFHAQKNIDAVDFINKKGGKNINGKSYVTRGEAAGILAEVTYTEAELSGTQFSDTSGHWARGEINALKKRGVLKGFDNKFNPAQNITRADLALVICRMLELPDTFSLNSVKLKDVPITRETGREILKLVYFDIMLLDGNDNFRPDQNVTAEELTAILDSLNRNNYMLNPDKLVYEAKYGKKIISPR